MRRGLTILFLCALVSGCGGARHGQTRTTRAVTTAVAERPTVGVVGPLRVDLPGVEQKRAVLGAPAGKIVLVAASAAPVAAVAIDARNHPDTYYAVVGASAAAYKLKNLLGVVLRDDEAAYVAGVTAGLTAVDQGGTTPRVAWVGPEERGLAAAFGRGVQAAAPDVEVLRQWARAIPARCKEAALIALDRGATVVMAHGGVCADAAAAAAHQQNLPALRLSDFQLPSVAAEQVVRDAVNGIYRGGEDLVFGVRTGAVGIGALDPRIPLATAARARASAQRVQSGIPPSR